MTELWPHISLPLYLSSYRTRSNIILCWILFIAVKKVIPKHFRFSAVRQNGESELSDLSNYECSIRISPRHSSNFELGREATFVIQFWDVIDLESNETSEGAVWTNMCILYTSFRGNLGTS